MNKLTKIVTIPIFLGSLIGVWLLIHNQISWWAPFICYFIFGVIINGTIAHRYFAHNSFVVPEVVRRFFGVLVILGGYGLPLIWIVQHRHHHVHSDKLSDVHTPKHGFWHAFIGWHSTLDKISAYSTLYQFKKNLRDPTIRFTTKNYFVIMWSWMLLLLIINWQFFFAGYCVGIIIDHIRLGLVNTVCHLPKLPGNYVNYYTKDRSQNNIFLGILGFGFGWHNNHHKNATQLILTNRWWEIDVEGYIGWIIDRIFKPFTK